MLENTTLPDEEILRLSLEDPSYFSVLVDKYQAAFLRKCLGIVHSKEEAEDIVQEAFVKIYRYADRFTKQEGIEFKKAFKVRGHPSTNCEINLSNFRNGFS